jgi:hypothetical protein
MYRFALLICCSFFIHHNATFSRQLSFDLLAGASRCTFYHVTVKDAVGSIRQSSTTPAHLHILLHHLKGEVSSNRIMMCENGA